jgi:hypothetical protein
MPCPLDTHDAHLFELPGITMLPSRGDAGFSRDLGG